MAAPALQADPAGPRPISLVGGDGQPVGVQPQTTAIHAEDQPLGDADPAGDKPQGSPISTALVLFAAAVAMFTLMRSLRKNRRQRMTTDSMTAREKIDSVRGQALGIPTQDEPRPHVRPSSTQSLERTMADAAELARRLAAQMENRAERLEQLIDLAEQRITRLEAATRASMRSPAPGKASADEPGTIGPDWQEEVHRLAGEGVAPMDIARTLNKPIGQVDLILKLRRGLPA